MDTSNKGGGEDNMKDRNQNDIPDAHEAYLVYGAGVGIILFGMAAFWFKDLDPSTLTFLIMFGSGLIGGKSYLKERLAERVINKEG